MCVTLQRDLFALGARLADPVAQDRRSASRRRRSTTRSVARLEGWIDRLDAELPPLRHFILSGGAPRRRGAAPGAHRVPPRRARGAVARHGRRRAGRARLPQSAVRSAVHDGARRQSPRRRRRDASGEPTIARISEASLCGAASSWRATHYENFPVASRLLPGAPAAARRGGLRLRPHRRRHRRRARPGAERAPAPARGIGAC